MPFTSLEFALFFGLALSLNWAFKSGPFFLRYLLVANLAFYGLAAPKFLPLLVIVALANFWTVRLMAAHPDFRRFYLTLNIVFCLSLLIFFKYFEFLISTFDSLGLLPTTSALFRLPEIVYPVGLSFFTFQGLSLAIDQYRTPDPKPPSLLNVLIFVSFFPTVLSGPIQRYRQFSAQLSYRRTDPDSLNLGLWLILSGLFKKVALSSYLSESVVRGVFQVPEAYSALGVLGGIYAYSAQIYLDFSGYSDLAQGVALLIGVDVGANFAAPYLATNVRDFWRRWHISLSTWLRDYLYVPLGGSRQGSKSLNLLLTQTLGGLWHGAHLRYAVWGVAHGLALVVCHFFLDFKRKRAAKNPGSLNHRQGTSPLGQFWGFFLTFNFVSFTWILFRAEDLNRALEIARAAINFSRPGQGVPLLAWLIVGLTLGGQVYGQKIKEFFLKRQARLSVPALGLWLAFWTILIIKLGPPGVLPFIYFQY
ncbi:MAG: MBOAT family protein [Deltaproteobacteria bacterium]|jgi:D-alanyl-lipoteichoic acid acyltransferase DltB (MBOAT superfamily)|nr:MBOAT family protein [Deltaproteobacteria bacterium]